MMRHMRTHRLLIACCILTLLAALLYLIVMVLTVGPSSLLLQWLLSPLLKSRLEGLRARLELPSGSQAFNLEKYDQSR